MSRPVKCRYICSKPKTTSFAPEGEGACEAVKVGFDELEVIRLLDYESLTQAQCANKMRISRPTVNRLYTQARNKLADALINGKRIEISGGNVLVCTALRPECIGEKHCCHQRQEETGGRL